MPAALSTPTVVAHYVSSSEVSTYIGLSGAVKPDLTQLALIGKVYSRLGTHAFLYGLDGNIVGNTFSASGKARILRFAQLCSQWGIRVAIPLGSINDNTLNAIYDFNVTVATNPTETIELTTEYEWWNLGYYAFVNMKTMFTSWQTLLAGSGAITHIYTGHTKVNGNSYGEDFSITGVSVGAGTMTFTTSVNHNFIAGAKCELVGVTGFATNPSGQFTMTAAASNTFTINFVSGGGVYGGGATVSSVYTGTTEIKELQTILNTATGARWHIHFYSLIQYYGYGSRRIREFTVPVKVSGIVSKESTTEPPIAANNFSGNLNVGKNPAGVPSFSVKGETEDYQYLVIDTGVGPYNYVPSQVAATPAYFNADATPSVVANVTFNGITMFTLTMMEGRVVANGPRILVYAGPDQSSPSTTGSITLSAAYAFDDWLPLAGALTYTWSVVTAPAGWSGGFNNVSLLNPIFSFTAAALGNYKLRLSVTDGDTGINSISEMNIIVAGTGGMTVTLTELKPITCDGDCDAEVRATITSGGVAPFTFAYSNGVTHSGILITTDDLTGICEGIVGVLVTDSLGATASATFNVIPPPPLVITLITTNPTCPGDSDGAIATTITGGSPLGIALISWTKNGVFYSNSEDLTGLTLGFYEITVTDNQGCVRISSTNIIEPVTMTEVHVIQEPTCFGLTNGIISVTVSNGTPGYTYQWLDPVGNIVVGGIASKITNVYAGAWTVVVTDANGCEQTFIFTVNNPVPINVVINPVGSPDFCLPGTIDLDSLVTGGVGVISYVWSPLANLVTYPGNPQLVTFVPTASGPYTIKLTVTDANGCVGFATVSGTVFPAATEVPIIVASGPLLQCIGNSITLTVTNASDFASLAWSTGETTSSIVVDYEDAFTVSAFDGNGCLSSADITIVSQPTTITLISIVNNACGGAGNTGAITIHTSGGCSPYTWVWRDQTGNIIATTESITGLTNGTYMVTATDSNGQTATASYVIFTTAPAVSLSSQNITITTPGSIYSLVSGGTPGYTYLWNTGDTTADLLNITQSGVYTLTVTDANGCKVSRSVVMIADDRLNLVVFNCCAADLAYNYVYERENGLLDKAQCTMLKLRLLHGYIADLCDYSDAIADGYETCITEDEKNIITERARLICGCCGCKGIYDDTLKI